MVLKLSTNKKEVKLEGFGDRIKVNPPQYIDYSLVTLPEKQKKNTSIDISYQPPEPVKQGKKFVYIY